MGTEINSFIEKFKDYTDCYTVIGGTACDILMTEAGTDFRATKDIDMILIMEAPHSEIMRQAVLMEKRALCTVLTALC